MPSTPVSTRRPVRARLRVGLLIVLIALAFQGSRAVWEPDEARYVDAAIGMLATGDLLVPRLQGLVYLDKPPFVYWTVVAGVAGLGRNEWAVRAGFAAAFALTALLVWLWGRELWGARSGRLAGAAFAVGLLPALAANIVTPDTLLALWTTATAMALWHYSGSTDRARRWCWALAAGAGLGLGMLTKGPAALVFAVPAVLFVLIDSRLRALLRIELWLASVVSLGIAGSWWWYLADTVPGAAAYLIDNQVSGRLWEGHYDRNSQWWYPFTVYLPTLIFGCLPWAVFWPRILKGRPPRAWIDLCLQSRWGRFLTLQIALPLAILSLASSRLPLYVLPLVPFLILATAGALAQNLSPPAWRRTILISAIVLVSLKALGGVWQTDRDTRRLAAELATAGVGSAECVDTLSVRGHGLRFYGFERTTWHNPHLDSYPYFEPPRYLEDDLAELLDGCDGRVWFLTKVGHRESLTQRFAAADLDCQSRALSPKVDLFDCRRPTAAGEL